MEKIIKDTLKLVDTMFQGDAMFSDEVLSTVKEYTTKWSAAIDEAESCFKQNKLTYCHICEAELKEENILKLHEQATCEVCYDGYQDRVKGEALENISYLKQSLEDKHGIFMATDILDAIIEHEIMVRNS